MKSIGRFAGFVAAGLLQAVSIAWPGSGQPLWWVQILSLALLVWQLDLLKAPIVRRPVRSGFLLGWAFTTAWLCGTFWWLFISLHTYGGLAAPLAVVAVLALAAGLSLYYAVACALWVWMSPPRWARPLVFASLWTLGELLRGSWFTGFPWGAGGYAHVEGPLSGYARWLGVYGVGAVSAGVAVLLCMLVQAARHARVDQAVPRGLRSMAAPVVAIVLLLSAPWLAGGHRAQADLSAGRLTIALLQGNIPQDEKFVPSGGIETALRWYGERLQANTASLVITPETALPLLPRQMPPGYLEAIQSRYARGSQAALIGLPLEEQGLYTNSVLGLRPNNPAPYRYDKHHLVPFGEFIPSFFRWFTELMHIPLGDFARGGLAQTAFEWRGQRLAPNICYEDLFGDEIGANFRDRTRLPTMLLNVSNIAWFGDSIAIDQHLAISRMRSLEFARPMVRSTNTGATVVIDHRGQVLHSLPRLTRGVLHAQVEGRHGLTPYARWVSGLGLAPMWVLCLGVVLVFAVRRGRRVPSDA